MSIQPTMNTSILQVPMPIPRTPNAPYFNGKYITDFLTVLIQHGANAGITDMNLLVLYILQYSSDEVKDLIRYMPEFDPDATGKTYNKAKDALMLLYGQADEPPNYTESMLRDFCRDQSAKSPFKDKKQIETYIQEFMKVAGPLIKMLKITEQQRDYYFISGIPSSIKEWFNNNRIVSEPIPLRCQCLLVFYRSVSTPTLCSSSHGRRRVIRGIVR